MCFNLRDKIVLKVKQNVVFISVCTCVYYVNTHGGQKSVYNQSPELELQVVVSH